jgi:hypothetical protein
MRETDVQLATGSRGKQILGRDLGPEGMPGEGEVFAVHGQKSSSSFRRGRPGGGALAGRSAVSRLVPWSRRTKQLA